MMGKVGRVTEPTIEALQERISQTPRKPSFKFECPVLAFAFVKESFLTW